jgi:hypothetical protein
MASLCYLVLVLTCFPVCPLSLTDVPCIATLLDSVLTGHHNCCMLVWQGIVVGIHMVYTFSTCVHASLSY